MYNLYKHQEIAIEIAKTKQSLCIFHDCGLGKTLTAIEIIKHFGGKALAVCPLSIIDDAWIADCKEFAPELNVVSLHSNKPAERIKKLNEEHDVYIVNYEQFKLLFDEIKQKEFNIIIVDESSKMKNPRSQITRALLALSGIKCRGRDGKKYVADKPILHRYVMSGTPAPNDESEYWAQTKFVAGLGRVFHDNFYAFRNRYFYPIPLGSSGINKYVFKREMQDEFAKRIASISHVVSKAEALDLPDQVHEIRKVYLSKNERISYDRFKRDLVLKYQDATILGSTALVEIMKLRQLASGFFYSDTKQPIEIGKSKINELLELLDEIGKYPVIIWTQFRYESALISKTLKYLGKTVVRLDGDTTHPALAIDFFKQGKSQYLIANPQTAQHGLTFTNCHYVVYFSLDYSLLKWEQSMNRVHRIGQTSKCTYYYLLADQTIDEPIYKILNKKADMSNEILVYLKGVKK